MTRQASAEAGWSAVGVPPRASSSVEATWPGPALSLVQLRRDLDAAGLTGPDVRVHQTVAGYHPAEVSRQQPGSNAASAHARPDSNCTQPQGNNHLIQSTALPLAGGLALT
jgi:hypothetical protein